VKDPVCGMAVEPGHAGGGLGGGGAWQKLDDPIVTWSSCVSHTCASDFHLAKHGADRWKTVAEK